jgi:hypothetical protein
MIAPDQSLLRPPAPPLPYLATAAATQGDKELPPWCHPRPIAPLPHVLEEIDFAANLFQRAERAVAAELAALAGAGIALDTNLSLRVQAGLAQLAALTQLTGIRIRENAPAFVRAANVDEILP